MLESRGEIEVKSKGTVRTFFLGRSASLAVANFPVVDDGVAGGASDSDDPFEQEEEEGPSLSAVAEASPPEDDGEGGGGPAPAAAAAAASSPVGIGMRRVASIDFDAALAHSAQVCATVERCPFGVFYARRKLSA